VVETDDGMCRHGETSFAIPPLSTSGHGIGDRG
jgi:hypothetical protein